MFWLIWPSSGVKIFVLGKLPCPFHPKCSYRASHVYNGVFLGDGPLFLCCLCVTVTEAVHCTETTWLENGLSIHDLHGHILSTPPTPPPQIDRGMYHISSYRDLKKWHLHYSLTFLNCHVPISEQQCAKNLTAVCIYFLQHWINAWWPCDFQCKKFSLFVEILMKLHVISLCYI
jgi:hypothetical protein